MAFLNSLVNYNSLFILSDFLRTQSVTCDKVKSFLPHPFQYLCHFFLALLHWLGPSKVMIVDILAFFPEFKGKS